jgi:ankyrin repeat protein/L-ascorbate metabolism protein UlaG (beta-lactamase superfamily)
MFRGKNKTPAKIAIILFLAAVFFLYSPAFQAPPEEIFKAAAEGDLAKVRELVEKDPELVNVRSEEESTPLHGAAAAGHLAIVEFLLSKGADIDARNSANQNPLFYAAYNGKADVVSLLLDKGADFKETDRYGRTVLHYPVREGYKDVVEILAGKGMDITAEDGMGISPLRFAVEGGHAGIMQVFIDSKALDVEGDTGIKALHLAAQLGQNEIVDLLIARGASITTKNDSGATLLHNAAIGRLLELSRRLIEGGAPLNERDARGRTPLHYAAKQGSVDIVGLLIKKGADPNIKGNDERTALHIAEDWGFKEIIQTLKAGGAAEVPRLAPKNPENPWVDITYISNDGFLIASETQKILVDSLIKNPWGYSDTPAKVFDDMVNARPPFEHIDLLLFSHAHRDHFEPEMAVKVLMGHPETILVGNEIVFKELKEAAGDDYSKISSQVKNVNPQWGTIVEETLKGVDFQIFPVNHSTPDRPYMTLAFILDMRGIKVLHMGDIYAQSNEEYFRTLQLQKHKIDVAFIDPFFLLDKTGRQLTEEFIQPEEIIPMHMRDYEIEKYVGFLKNIYTNINVFRECLEKKIFEDL